MQQLLQIENIPIKLEIKSTRAKFEKPDITEIADLNSSAQNVNNIQTQSAHKIKSKASGYPARDAYESSVKSQSLSYSQMMSYVSNSYASANSAIQNMTATPAYVQAGIQNTQAQAQAQASGLSMKDQISMRSEAMKSYSTDKTNFNLNVSLGKMNFEFVPGSIEFTVAQRPEVKIEYVGSPIYVPASAAPDYVDVYA